MSSPRSSYARSALGFGILVQLFLLGLGAFGDHIFATAPVGSWTNSYIAACISLVLLLIGAGLIHEGDSGKDQAGKRGFGVKYLFFQTGKKRRTDDSVIAGILAREAIQAAITVGVLALLLDKAIEKDSVPQSILAICWRDPKVVIASVIALVLLTSVITTLAGILCYDYSSRFHWPEKVRTAFVKKGHRFGTYGFYALMWSLSAIPALLDPWLCMAIVLFVFLVMWSYYFFPADVLREDPPISNLTGANLSHRDFNGVDFSTLSISGADLTGADLTHALNLTQPQVDSAIGSKSTTKLPPGINPPVSWPA